MTRIVSLALLALVIAAASPAHAQSEMTQWLHPRLGRLTGQAEYRYTFFPDASVARQGTELGFHQQNVRLVVPLHQDASDEWTFSARMRAQDFDTRALFPASRTTLPDELWDVRFGTAYRHKLDNGWIIGASLTIGSASDKPFSDADDLLIQAFGLLRVPARNKDAWLFSLIYDSDNEFLGGIPIPGVAYLWAPSKAFDAVIGVPFSGISWKPLAPLTIEARYTPVRHVNARVTWEIARPLRVYVDFDWDTERYLLTNRADRDQRLMYDEKRLTGALRFDLRYVGIEAYGGWLLDRFYFLGENYGDRARDRFDVKSGPFVGVRLNARW